MEAIDVRYGASTDVAVESDDLTAVEATLFVGKLGETPVLMKTIELTDGVGVFELSSTDTQLPVGVYNYQINILHSDGDLEKYPEPEDCEDGELPTFEIHEALDSPTVVS